MNDLQCSIYIYLYVTITYKNANSIQILLHIYDILIIFKLMGNINDSQRYYFFFHDLIQTCLVKIKFIIINSFFCFKPVLQLSQKMKTPMKQVEPNTIESKQKSSLKKSVKQRKEQQEFNPSLYITSNITIEDVLQIKQAFDHYDINHTGVLTPNDLKLALYQQNFHANRQTLFSILAEYDEQGLGVLTFPAFINIILCDPSEAETTDDLKKMFRKYDRGNKGYIDYQDLEHIVKVLNQNISAKQLKQIFEVLDRNNTGQLKYQDFAMIVHHPSCFQ